jgi:hypothetical protein
MAFRKNKKRKATQRNLAGTPHCGCWGVLLRHVRLRCVARYTNPVTRIINVYIDSPGRRTHFEASGREHGPPTADRRPPIARYMVSHIVYISIFPSAPSSHRSMAFLHLPVPASHGFRDWAPLDCRLLGLWRERFLAPCEFPS